MPAGENYDGMVRAYWLDTNPADPANPTLAEIAAGTDLSGYLLPDGVAYNMGNSRVSGADLLSSFDAESMGRFQAAPVLTLRRRLLDGGTVAWDTLGDRHIIGSLVVFESIIEDTDPVAGDECFVFTSCQTGQPKPLNTAMNTEKRFECELAVGGKPYLHAAAHA
jgi:hypothetical protein